MRRGARSSSRRSNRSTARSTRTTPDQSLPAAQVSRPDLSVPKVVAATPDFDTVQLADVSRHFGRRRALAKITLTARAGDIVGLLGPNGAGKSTLISVMATLARPTSGEVLYGGETADRLGVALRRRLGLLGHELFLYPELTARQNLAFFADLYGLDARTVVDAALERAGLADRADDDVSGFSRGMRQRLALERALLHAPRLALFDEPFTGLGDRSVGLAAERRRGLGP